MQTRKRQVKSFQATINTGGVDAILSRSFRGLVNAIGIKDEGRFDARMGRYAQKALMSNAPDAEDQYRLRLSLIKELKKEALTWKTFMRGLEAMGVEVFEVELKCYDKQGNVSSYKRSSGILSDKEAGSFLAGLFADIVTKRNILQSGHYEQLMNDYIDASRPDAHPRQRATIRAGLSKELFKSNMTWKTFIKGLIFLQIEKFDFGVKIVDVFHKTHHYEFPVILSAEMTE